MAFTIKVNGQMHSVEVDGDTPLLRVLNICRCGTYVRIRVAFSVQR
jgi:aerobic-type carbon monoxide dehydrogenase small subunit (CoxS/CutS family)